MRRLTKTMFVCAMPLAGCANVNSIYRTLDLGPDASAVAVDIKQRAIFRTTFPTKGANGASVEATVICSEPSPDALSAYSTSGGLSALLEEAGVAGAGSTKARAQAAFAAGEKAASVGLRTQSIQLLRDGLFTDCAAYMNQAISGQDWYRLRRRNQDFTLGLLAIEQLTGTVKADQAALDASADAAAGSDNVDKQTSALEAAQKTQSQAIADREAADAAVKSAQTERDDANTSLIKLKAAQAALKNPDDAAKAKAQSDVDAAAKDLAAKEKDLGAKSTDQGLKARAVGAANDQVAAARENLQSAQMRVRALATGSAQLLASGGTRAVVADKVADAVVQIVKDVLKSSGEGETCLALLSVAAQSGLKSDETNGLLSAMDRACGTTEKTDAARTLVLSGQSDFASRLLQTIPKAIVPAPKPPPPAPSQPAAAPSPPQPAPAQPAPSPAPSQPAPSLSPIK